jgi:thiamine transporter ThiT
LVKVFAPKFVRSIEQYGQYIMIWFVLIFIRGPWSGLLQSYIIGVSRFIFGLLYTIFSLPVQLFL